MTLHIIVCITSRVSLSLVVSCPSRRRYTRNSNSRHDCSYNLAPTEIEAAWLRRHRQKRQNSTRQSSTKDRPPPTSLTNTHTELINSRGWSAINRPATTTQRHVCRAMYGTPSTHASSRLLYPVKNPQNVDAIRSQGRRRRLYRTVSSTEVSASRRADS